MSSETRPRIARGYRLQWEEAQQAHVVLYPEGMVQLNASAALILQRCDGERTSAQIAAELESEFRAGIAAEILAFIDDALARGWLQESP